MMFSAPALDPTISLGNILTIAVTIGSIVIASWRMSLRLVRLETEFEMKMDMLWKDYCQRHGINGKKPDILP